MTDSAESYRAALADLTFNSKPMINMLTMLAEENEQTATQIVQVIEEEIEKAPAQQKLPILYLIDSMIKNLSSTLYPQLFIQNIVTLFCRVFEEVDEKTRTAMYKLRQTWVKCIPNNKLFALDVRVKRIDPAWPITAKPPEQGSIHVNPKFLVSQAKQAQAGSGENSPTWSSSPQSEATLPDRSPDDKMKELQAKEEELKRLKLELELAQTRAKLEQEKRKYEQKVEEEEARLRATQDFMSVDGPGSTPPDFSSGPLPRTTGASQSSSSASARSRDPRLARNPDLASSVASRDPRRRNQGPTSQQQLTPTSQAQPSIISNQVPPLTSMPQQLLSQTLTPAGAGLQPIPPVPAIPVVPAPVGEDLAALADWFTSAGNTHVATTAPATEPRPVHAEPKTPNLSNKPSNKEALLSTIPLPNNAQSSATAKQGKQSKKPAKQKTPPEKTVPEKTPAPVKFKINTSEVPSTPPPLKLQPAVVKKKVVPKTDAKGSLNEDSVLTSAKLRKSETNPEVKKTDKTVEEISEKEDKPVEKDLSKEKKLEKKSDKETDNSEKSPRKTDKTSSISREKKSTSSHRSLSTERRDHERRDSKDSDRSRSGEDRSHSSKERHVAKERERRGREEKTDHRKSPPHRSTFRGRVSRGRGRGRSYHYRSRSRSVSRSRSRSPIKGDKRKSIDQNSCITTSSSGSDVASSKGTVSAASSQEKIIDVDDRAAAKRSLDSDDNLAPQPKKARPVSGDNSTTDVSVGESDSKEDIEKLFSGQDIDYRQQGGSLMQSPAQQRWSKFKENHPEDFTLELERRKSMDEVRRASLEAAGVSGPRHRDFDRDLHDVDFRRRSILQPGLTRRPLVRADIKESIPQALSLEHQEEIMMQAEQELRAGRMSHEEHQNLLRQLGQVFDIQRQQRKTSDRGEADWNDPSRHGDPHLRDHKLASRKEIQDDVDHRRLFDSDFRKSGSDRPQDSVHESHADRDFRASRGEEGDVDLRRSGRREEAAPYGSPRADFDARDSPRSDFDGRRGPRQDYDSGREGPKRDHRFGARPDFARGERPRDFEGREGAREYGGSPHADFEDMPHGEPRSKRPLLGIAPGVPVDAHHVKSDERGPTTDYDKRDLHRRVPRRPDFEGNRPSRPDFRHGPDRNADYDYDARGMPRDFDYRGPLRDYEGRVHTRDFDHRGAPRDFDGRGPPREFDDRGPPREFDDRNLPREHEGRMGPVDSFPLNRSERVPHGEIREPYHPGFEGGPFNGPRPSFLGAGPRPLRPRVPVQGPTGPRGLAPHMHQDSLARFSDDAPIASSPMDDPRWSVMRGLLGNEVKEEIVIDGKPFEVRMGVERRIKIYNVVYDVLIDPLDRGIRVNGELVYKFGEPKKDISLGGKVVEIFYHGPHRDIWIDGQQYRLRVDAPPLNMVFDNTIYGFQIDGRDNMILVDRLEKGTLGGPPRPLILNGVHHEISFEPPPRRILIDNQSCELKLDRKIPVIMYNNKPHGIRFEGDPRNIYINDVPYLVPFDRAVKVKIGPRPHFLAFGGPAHEVIIDGRWYEVKFNNNPKNITIGNRICSVRLEPPVPRVKILSEMTEAYDESALLKSNRPSPFARTPQQLSPKADLRHPHPVDSVTIGVRQRIDADVTSKPIVEPGSIGQNQPMPVAGISTSIVGALHEKSPLPVVCTSQAVAASLAQDVSSGKPPAPIAETTTVNQSPKPVVSMQQGTEALHLQGIGMRPPHQQSVRFQGTGCSVGQGPVGGPMQGPRPGPGAMLQAQNLMGNPMLLANMMQGLPMMPVTMPQILGLPEALMGIQRMMSPQMGGNPFAQPMTSPPFIGNPTLPRMISPSPNPFATTGPQIGPMSIHQSMVTQSSTPQTSHQTLVTPATPLAPAAGPGASPPPPVAAAGGGASMLDVKDLFEKLVAVGIIRKEEKKEETTVSLEVAKPKEAFAEIQQEVVEQKPLVPAVKPKIVIPKKEPVFERPPDLSDFQSVKLKKQYSEVVHLLYHGIQCSSCGCRFPMSETEKYRQHLDWHFRANKREKEAAKIASYRKWYYEMNEWILYEELEESEEKLRSSVFEEEASAHSAENQVSSFPLQIPEGVEVVHNPTATGNEKEDVCLICNDPFEQYWDEEAEDWHLRDAIKVDGKVYHPVCYEDAKEGSGAVVTPTPTVDVTVNPLETQLQHSASAGVAFEEVPAPTRATEKWETNVKTEPLPIEEAHTPAASSASSADSLPEAKHEISDSSLPVKTDTATTAADTSHSVSSEIILVPVVVKTEPSSDNVTEPLTVPVKVEPTDSLIPEQTCAEATLNKTICNTSSTPTMSPALEQVADVTKEPSAVEESVSKD